MEHGRRAKIRSLLKPLAMGVPAAAVVVAVTMFDSPATPPNVLRPVAFPYDVLDTSGYASAPGSYAFLRTAGDPASAIDTFGHAASGSVELRIHSTDANGTSRAHFYDTIEVGDVFDYRVNRGHCRSFFRVTTVEATMSPRTFGIEDVTSPAVTRCNALVDLETPKRVEFFWRARPDAPDKILLDGPGTYPIGRGWTIVVPAGMTVIKGGVFLARPGGWGIPLVDEASGSVMYISLETGTEGWLREITDASVEILFDQISASIRR